MSFIVDNNLSPVAFGLVFIAVTAVRSVWLRVSAGVNAYVIDHSDPVHGFTAAIFFAVVAGLIGYFCAIAASPALEDALGLLDWAVTRTTTSSVTRAPTPSSVDLATTP